MHIRIINLQIDTVGYCLFSCQQPVRQTALFKKGVQPAVRRLGRLAVESAEGEEFFLILHREGAAVVRIRQDPLRVADQIQESVRAYRPESLIGIAFIAADIFVHMGKRRDPAAGRLSQSGSKLPVRRIISQKITEDIVPLQQRSMLLNVHPLSAVKQKSGIRDNRYSAAGKFRDQLLSGAFPYADVPYMRQKPHGGSFTAAGKCLLPEARRIGDCVDRIRHKAQRIIIRGNIGGEPELIASHEHGTVSVGTGF